MIPYKSCSYIKLHRWISYPTTRPFTKFAMMMLFIVHWKATKRPSTLSTKGIKMCISHASLFNSTSHMKYLMGNHVLLLWNNKTQELQSLISLNHQQPNYCDQEFEWDGITLMLTFTLGPEICWPFATVKSTRSFCSKISDPKRKVSTKWMKISIVFHFNMMSRNPC